MYSLNNFTTCWECMGNYKINVKLIPGFSYYNWFHQLSRNNNNYCPTIRAGNISGRTFVFTSFCIAKVSTAYTLSRSYVLITGSAIWLCVPCYNWFRVSLRSKTDLNNLYNGKFPRIDILVREPTCFNPIEDLQGMDFTILILLLNLNDSNLPFQTGKWSRWWLVIY